MCLAQGLACKASSLNYSSRAKHSFLSQLQPHEWHDIPSDIQKNLFYIRKRFSSSLLRRFQYVFSFNTLSLFISFCNWLIYLRNWNENVKIKVCWMARRIDEEEIYKKPCSTSTNCRKKAKVIWTLFAASQNGSFISFFAQTFNLFSAN